MLNVGDVYASLSLDTSGWSAGLQSAGKSMASFTAAATSIGGVAAAGIAAAGIAAATAAAGFSAFTGALSSIMTASGELEAFEVRLTSIMGSSEDAKERLEELVDFAATTPFEIPGVVGAEVTLRAFGANAEALMGGLMDFAAGSGLALEQAAIDLGKAWTQGAVALESDGAKMLRSMIQARTKIDATKMSIEDFRAAMLEELNTGRFAGAAIAMSTTWQGLVSNMMDAWGGFKREIGDAGLFNNVKAFLSSMLQLFNQNEQAVGEVARMISTVMWGAFKSIVGAIATAIDMTEVWAYALARAGEFLLFVANSYLDTLLQAVNAAASAAEALGFDEQAAQMDAVGDRIFRAVSGMEALRQQAQGFAAGLDTSSDKLLSAFNMLKAAENAPAGKVVTGGSKSADTAAAAIAGASAEADNAALDAWYNSLAMMTGAIDAQMSALDGALDSTIDALDELYKSAERAAGFWADLKGKALASLGDVGTVISDGIAGFAAAGVAGAVAGAAFALIQSSPDLDAMVDALNTALAGTLTALAPVFTGLLTLLLPALNVVAVVLGALAPAFDIVGQILAQLAPIIMVLTPIIAVVAQLFGTLAAMLEPVMGALDVAFRVIFTVFQWVGIAMLTVVLAIQKVWNGIINAIASVVKAISDALGGVLDGVVNRLNDMKADSAGTADALETLKDMTYDSALAEAEAAANTALMGEAAAEATEALTNVPSGYKIALSRFDSMAAEMAEVVASVGGSTSTGTTGGSRGGGSFSDAVAAIVDAVNDAAGSSSGSGSSGSSGRSRGTTGGSRSRRGRGSSGGSVTVNIGRAELAASSVTDLALSAEKIASRRRRALESLPIDAGSSYLIAGS